MWRVLRHRVYGRLFAAQVVALIGTGLATVGLGLLAYDLAGERASLMLGAVFAVKMVAYVLVAPLAAAAVAGLPRRAVMVGADLVRFSVALMLPFVTQLWQVFVLVFVLQAASATFTPTFQSVIPLVLPNEDEYTEALSLSRLAYDLEAIASPMLAALLLLVVPANALFLGTALGFAGSAALVLAAQLPRLLGIASAADGPVAPFGARACEGVSLFLRTPQLRPILALNLAVASAGAFVIVQTVVIVRAELALPEASVALFLAINGAGSMTAALALPRLLRRVDERRVMLPAALLLAVVTAVAGAALMAPAGAWKPFVLGLVWFLIGIGWSCAETPVGRIIRSSVPAESLPGAFAAQFSLSHACWLLTYPLTGALGQLGLPLTALVLAGIAAASGVVATLWWKAQPVGVEA